MYDFIFLIINFFIIKNEFTPIHTFANFVWIWFIILNLYQKLNGWVVSLFKILKLNFIF